MDELRRESFRSESSQCSKRSVDISKEVGIIIVGPSASGSTLRSAQTITNNMITAYRTLLYNTIFYTLANAIVSALNSFFNLNSFEMGRSYIYNFCCKQLHNVCTRSFVCLNKAIMLRDKLFNFDLGFDYSSKFISVHQFIRH